MRHAIPQELRTTALAVGVALLLSTLTPTTSNGAANQLDLAQINDDLVGTVFVVGGEVYSEDLKPLAKMEEYVEQFEDAGAVIDEAQAEVTEVPDGIDEVVATAPSSLMNLGQLGSHRVRAEAPGCAGHDQYRSIQRFQRGGKGGVVARGVADLACGGATSWGWRHIASKHGPEFATIGRPSGKSWETFAKWVIGQTLGTPKTITYQPGNKSYLYNAPIQIWENGKLKKTYTAFVPVANASGGWRIITAFMKG